jgi:hypothetical protein
MRYSEAREILAEAMLDILEGPSMQSPKPKSFNKSFKKDALERGSRHLFVKGGKRRR